MPRVSAVDGHMNDGTIIALFALVPLSAYQVHHLRIAHSNLTPLDGGLNTLAGNLFHIGHLATIGRFFWEGIAQGGTNGVCSRVFYVSSQMQ